MSVFIYALIGGLLIPIFGLLLSVTLEKYTERYRKSRRPYNSNQVQFIPCASIAKDLVPLIDRLLPKNAKAKDSTIQIVGTDGRYFVKSNGRGWKEAIETWVHRGLIVEYFFVRLDDRARNVVADLVDKACQDHDSNCLTVYELKNPQDEDKDSKSEKNTPNDCPPKDRERLLRQLLGESGTRHPTLFHGEQGEKAMWLEGKHLDDSEIAYNVRYVSPEAMNDDFKQRFEELHGAIESLKEGGHFVILSSNRQRSTTSS